MSNRNVTLTLIIILMLFVLVFLISATMTPNIEKSSRQNQLSVVTATCSADHLKLVINHQGWPFGHWIEIVIRNQNSATKYLTGYWGPNEVEFSTLDGYVPGHIFVSGETYTIRVWKHPFESNPRFEEENLVFESKFSVPNCK